jgi:phosphoglucosamine mutase
MGRLFGTDGVRGIAGRDLSADLAMHLGRAAVVSFGRHGTDRPTFVVGRDTRASGEFLEAALVAGICSAGGNVALAGVATTPQVALLTVELGADSGVVLSASHNPPEYNGIKFFSRDGYKLPDDVEDEIEALLDEPGPRAEGLDVGRVHPLEDAAERYLRHVLEAAEAPLEGWRLVVDCANGAASDVAPEAYRRLGAEVVAINDRPDGTNINIHCGATHPDVVAKAVLEHGAHAGVAHDGDADRAMFCDAEGNVVDGDQVLAAVATAYHRTGRLPEATVVSTVMANLGFRKAMEEEGIATIAAKVGDRYVLEEMRRAGATLGGEQSGHVIFADHNTTGDGIVTAVRFLTLAAAQGRSVAELASTMRRYPQVLVNVRVLDRAGLDGAGEVWTAVEEAERALGDGGRVLVRPSGTEPLVRVMVEASSEADARAHADAIATAVERALAGERED